MATVLRPTFAAAALLALLSIAASCGSSEDTASGEPLTKAQFVKRATVICQNEAAKKYPRLKKVGGDEFLKAPPSELKELVVKVFLPLYQELISELAGLDPPVEDKAQVERILSSYEAVLKEAEADPGSLLRSEPFTKPRDMAAKYGIENCNL